MSDAPQASDRSILPLPEPQHPAITEIDARKATPPPRFELKPPKGAGAPNVVFILMDNFGFGDPGCFGGPVNMPAFERLAKGGLRYNNMHTAPVCSPTRVALLTGRNSHSANMGGVAEMGTAFPGHELRSVPSPLRRWPRSCGSTATAPPCSANATSCRRGN